jgi:hypothetical protein
MPGGSGESAHQNPPAGEMIQPIAFIRSLEQAEQIGTAKYLKARLLQHMIEALSILRKAHPRR